jgi:hypothetical protein
VPPRRRRPRGHIRALPSGNFQAIVNAGIDPLTGKERYLRKTATTYDEAGVTLTRLQGQKFYGQGRASTGLVRVPSLGNARGCARAGRYLGVKLTAGRGRGAVGGGLRAS